MASESTDAAAGAQHTHCDCGKALTAEERYYYGHTCEACERRQMGREDEADRQSEIDAAIARTLELVAEWLRERSTVCQKAGNHYRANALSDHADLIERGAFSAWLKAREARGG